MACGILDELYWRSTPVETAALMDAFAKREAEIERRAVLRAGLIAATIHNENPYRPRGSRTMQPKDYLRDKRGPKLGSPEWIEKMHGWAERHNQRVM